LLLNAFLIYKGWGSVWRRKNQPQLEQQQPSSSSDNNNNVKSPTTKRTKSAEQISKPTIVKPNIVVEKFVLAFCFHFDFFLNNNF
jgi:hypothetical protein